MHWTICWMPYGKLACSCFISIDLHALSTEDMGNMVEVPNCMYKHICVGT